MNSKYFFPSLLSLITLLTAFQLSAQEPKSYKVACVGFYNLENLFDIEDDTTIRDEEYTPAGSKAWDETKYQNKLGNMAKVIKDLGTDISPDGTVILGVCEIENKRVLEDLVAEEAIKGRDYNIVHYDSPDRRGIDVALLYQPKYFKVKNSNSYALKFADKPDYLTRDQLVVTGELDGEELSIIVGHWPSRSGGQFASESRRVQAAQLCRKIVDSLQTKNPDAKIIVMGDLNDDPVDKSVTEALNAQGKIKKLKDNKQLYNTMFKHYKKGDCTIAWRDVWNLFDQLIISQPLIGDGESSYQFYKSYVFSKDYLKQKEGLYKGFPLRTHAGGNYLNGYSDHFPVYLVLRKAVN